MTLPFRVAPALLSSTYGVMCARLDERRFAEALWSERPDAWTSNPATQDEIRNRLGWLRAIDWVSPLLPRIKTAADRIRTEGHADIVLLGMGGSSLAPEVMRRVLDLAPGYPRFRMLDSVDPDAVRDAMANAASSLFILASKSGSTIEPNVMAAEARKRIIAGGDARWGSRFIAITDENTELHRRAVAEGFREIFVNPSDIGGRYSALSFFGMVPAALMGADVDALIAHARAMDAACRISPADANPGLALGAYMAAGAASGRDKLTLLVPARLASFGLWVEQLVAESTGKHGTGIVPVTGERAAAPMDDRAYVIVSLAGERPDPQVLERVFASGLPVFEIEVPAASALGAEFLRWEVATAAAGFLLEINPFDEPNVQQAKDATRALLDSYRTSGRLPVREPHAVVDRIQLTLSAAAEQQLAGAGAEKFLNVIRPGDYFGLLAYLPPDREPFESVLQSVRTTVGNAVRCATMFGYGPRYLHSTGQLHKGGANNGVFVIITAAVDDDLPIEGEPFSFGVLEMAQALGDFASLDATGRRALHVHLPRRDVELLRRLCDRLTSQ